VVFGAAGTQTAETLVFSGATRPAPTWFGSRTVIAGRRSTSGATACCPRGVSATVLGAGIERPRGLGATVLGAAIERPRGLGAAVLGEAIERPRGLGAAVLGAGIERP